MICFVIDLNLSLLFVLVLQRCADPISVYQSQNEVIPRDDLDYTHHSYQDMEKVSRECIW